MLQTASEREEMGARALMSLQTPLLRGHLVRDSPYKSPKGPTRSRGQTQARTQARNRPQPQIHPRLQHPSTHKPARPRCELKPHRRPAAASPTLPTQNLPTDNLRGDTYHHLLRIYQLLMREAIITKNAETYEREHDRACQTLERLEAKLQLLNEDSHTQEETYIRLLAEYERAEVQAKAQAAASAQQSVPAREALLEDINDAYLQFNLSISAIIEARSDVRSLTSCMQHVEAKHTTLMDELKTVCTAVNRAYCSLIRHMSVADTYKLHQLVRLLHDLATYVVTKSQTHQQALQEAADTQDAHVQCTICCTRPITSMLQCCAHVVCRACVDTLCKGPTDAKCPFCRAPLQSAKVTDLVF